MLEQSYREAIDFISNTGSGITDEKSLQDAITSRCPHYDILKEVMWDRPSSRPLITNEDEYFEDLTMENKGKNDNLSSSEQSDDDVKVRGKCKRKRNVDKKMYRSIRSRSSSVSSSLSDWVDINTSMMMAKKEDHAVQKKIHSDHLELNRMKFELEKRKLACKEEESKQRVVLLQVQVEREKAQSLRETMLYKVELARNRKLLREEGVPEEEIDKLLPLN